MSGFLVSIRARLEDREVTRAHYGHTLSHVNDSNNSNDDAEGKPKETLRDLPGYATTQLRNDANAATREENAVWTDFVKLKRMPNACMPQTL